MEDALEVYQRPHDPEYPLVCLDETSKQLERFPIVASRLWVTWILKTCRMGESP
jgi:hypothetical protein